MSFVNKFMQFIGLAEEEEKIPATPPVKEAEEPQNDVMSVQRKGTVVNLHTNKQVKVILSEPECYSDAQMIADYLRARRPVVINLHKAPFDQAIRVIDFISGTIYALGGRMDKIGHQIFLCAPENVDVQGSISEFLNTKDEQHRVSQSQLR
jgi:cell division inhibitor SepF